MNEEKKNSETPWYFRKWLIWTAFLSVGPLALPLVWFHPRLGILAKIVITVLVLVLTYFICLASWASFKLLLSYGKPLAEMLFPA